MSGVRRRFGILAALLGVTLVLAPVPQSAAQSLDPTFSKAFNPATIGPGSTSTLTFTIDNSGGTVTVDELAFSDTLPVDTAIAGPSAVVNDCGGTVTAPDGGGTISLSDGQLGIGETCTISVNVVGNAVDASDTVHSNTSGTLTSDAGSHGTASADLTVDIDRPGFTKSFAPSTVAFGGRSTLTFTIDNSLNASAATAMSFVDTLPAGMVVADPANASTDCDFFATPVVTAAPGTDVVSLVSGGVDDTDSCTVTVDVVGGAVGSLGNTSDELFATVGFVNLSSGMASAVLDVTGVTDLLELSKEFTDDPVPPGGTVALEFTVTNKSHDDSATAITFSDDLETTLTGLAPAGPLPTDPCSAGSSLAFSMAGVLTLTGGSLPPEGSCTFTVDLDVPGTSAPGSYPNTAGPVSGLVGGSPETGNVAGDSLFVVSFPILTKTFTDDPVAAGDSVTLEFTITDTTTSGGSTDIAFIDELTAGAGDSGATGGFLPFPVSVTLPPVPDPPCGLGSALALVSLGTERQGLSLTGGSLGVGASCTFEVTVDIPAGLANGTYTNTTEEITATVAASTVTGPPASDDLFVVAGPSLRKEFTDDPIAPGDTVTLEFTLEHDEFAPGDATGIGFTDDLAATVAGLTATGLPLTEVCDPDGEGGVAGTGTLSSSMGDTLLTFSGGVLGPGESCTFLVTLASSTMTTPLGIHTNTTSDVTATVLGKAVTDPGPSDDLLVTTLDFTKEFTDDPIIPGGTGTLRFTLDNTSATDDATGITFTDDLDDTLSGLVAVAPPATPCGGALSGTSLLSFTGGTVDAGANCSFDVTVMVPAASTGSYVNTTSGLLATIGGSAVTLPPAADGLEVSDELLELTKEFTDDPAQAGGTVTLEFILTNLDPGEAASAIAFTDNLGDSGGALSGLAATGLPASECGGTLSGTTTLDFTGGSLAAGASCTFSATLDVPPGAAADTYANTTSDVSGTITGLAVVGAPASDDLRVVAVTFSKAFGGTIFAGTSGTLTFTIENLDATSGIGDLSFSDDLDTVLTGLVATDLPKSDICGTGSQLAGTSFLTFTDGSLAPSETCTFDVTVAVPLATSTGGYFNTSSDLFSVGLPVSPPATDTLTVIREADISVTKDDGVTSAVPGTSLTYTIVVANAGPSADPLVTVTDVFPSELTCTYTSVTMGGATGNTAAGIGDIGDTLSMPAGSSVTYTAACTIDAAATGTLSNTATAEPSVSDEDPVPGNNSATDGDTVLTPEADLAISKSDSPDSVVSGQDTLTYTIVVDNDGPSDATGVEVVDALPAGVTYVSDTDSCVEGPAGTLTCALGTIAAGSSVSFDITVTVDADTPAGIIANTATVSSDTTDPDPTDNSDTENTTVAPEADISVTKDDGVTSAVPGQDTITYTIVVANAGPSEDGAVSVADTFPTGLTCTYTSVAAGGATGNTASGSGNIADTMTMPPGSSVTYTVMCTIDPATTGTLSNTATATPSVTDPDTENNSATDSDTVLQGETEVGLFDTTNASWSLRLGDGSTVTFTYGNPGDLGVMGDWDGDGHRTPGVYRPSTLTFFGRNSNSAGPADFSFRVGEAGDMPVSGDWHGTGADSLALYRPSTQQFFVYDDFANVVVDHTLTFGDPSDTPFSGDVDGDGDDDIAVRRSSGPQAGRNFFRTSLTTGPADVIFTYGDGPDRPFFGDWDFDGHDSIGVYRPGDATFYLRNSNTAGIADTTIPFGGGSETPLAGPF